MSLDSIFSGEPLDHVLRYILQGTETKYRFSGTTLIITPYKLEKYRLYGTVRDSLSGQYIPHALVSYGSHHYARADEYGDYNIMVPAGKHKVICTALGFTDRAQMIEIENTIKLDIHLPYNHLLTEIVITDEEATRVSNHYEHYGYKYLQHLSLHTPGLGGIHDIMHTVRSLPGIQSGSGGIGGHYVRGSANSENLILLDGATIYYPYHALGIASIFDPKFVSNMQVFKSSFSPKYGGRAASVVDIHIREGSKDRWQATSSLSLQTADMMIEGPLFKKNASIMAYGRIKSIGTSLDNIINNNLFYTDDGDSRFNDILIKYQHGFGGDHKLQLTYFNSHDQVGTKVDLTDQDEFEFENTLNWSNEILTAKWRSILSSSTILSAGMSISKYNNEFAELYYEYENKELDTESYYETASSNQDIQLNTNLDMHNTLGHNIKLGWISIKHNMSPSTFYTEDETELENIDNLSEIDELVDAFQLQQFTPWTHALHLNMQKLLGDWSLDYGMRYSIFTNKEATYHNGEPRISIAYSPFDRHTFTLSGARMVQYVHLLSNSAVNLPRDIWYPSGEILDPQSIWHGELGWQYDMTHHWSLDVRAYTKDISGFQIQNASYIQLDSAEYTYILQGNGSSYGLEINLSKKVNRLKGNISYSIANSSREIFDYNQDKKFAFQFDRRHELKLLGTYQLNDKLDLGMSAYLGSGHPKVLAYYADLNNGIEQVDLSEFGIKNQDRTGAHYRLDLSVQYTHQVKQTTHNLKLAAYNITNSANPLFYLSDGLGEFQEPGFSVPFIPSLHYTVKF